MVHCSEDVSTLFYGGFGELYLELEGVGTQRERAY